MKFKIRGVECEVKFLFVALLAFFLIIDKTLNVFLTLLSSLIHECGHLFAMILSGNKPEKVVFELGGINIINRSKTCLSFNKEIIIAFSGPLVNLVSTLLCCFVYDYVKNEKILTFASVNLILMVFNLLPIKSLDGGRILYYFLSKKHNMSFSKRIIYVLSIIFIAITFSWGIYVFIHTGFNFSIIIIAVFLLLSLFSDNEC